VWRNWRKAEKAGLLIVLLLSALFLLSPAGNFQAEPHPIYFAEGDENKVALTFETMWSGRNLDLILAILDDHSVRATFFITGAWLKNHPDKAKIILAGGHEIGNHTMNHRNLLTLSRLDLVRELKDFNQLAMEILEYRPRLFRPPSGGYNGQVLRLAEQMGCLTIMWSVDSYDWISASSADIINRVAERVHQGAIISFRVEAPLLAEALPGILVMLRQKGYAPSRVSEIL